MWHYAFVLLCGAFGSFLYNKIVYRWNYRYRFTCPHCDGYKIASNKKEFIDQMSEKHLETCDG